MAEFMISISGSAINGGGEARVRRSLELIIRHGSGSLSVSILSNRPDGLSLSTQHPAWLGR